MRWVLFLLLVVFWSHLARADDDVSSDAHATNVKSCGTSPCSALYEAVESVAGKVSVPRPTRKTFARFKTGSSMLEIFRAAGYPSKDVGSGVFILIYELENGATCTVSTKSLDGVADTVSCN